MPDRNRKLRIVTLIAIGAACLAVAGCAGNSSGSSGDATALLKQTFCGKHNVNSGKLNVGLTIDPSGSRTITGPISLSLSGPFQSQGQGKLPDSDLTVALGALGTSISLGVISTGGHGYVTMTGSNYRLPQSAYQKLEASFSTFAKPPGCNGKSGALSGLHIRPLHWLSNPQVVGTENVGGANTTHIHSGINVSALLSDLGSLLKNAPGLSGAGGLSGSTLSNLASQVQNPSFDVWTGTNDKTLRKLNVHLTLPVSGQISTLLGGLNKAGIGVTMAYSDLNQPQTITAPGNLQPYSQLQAKLAELFSAIRSQLGSVISGGLGGSSSSGSGATGGGSNLQKYSACIQAAGGQVTKMQKCAPLLSGK